MASKRYLGHHNDAANGNEIIRSEQDIAYVLGLIDLTRAMYVSRGTREDDTYIEAIRSATGRVYQLEAIAHAGRAALSTGFIAGRARVETVRNIHRSFALAYALNGRLATAAAIQCSFDNNDWVQALQLHSSARIYYSRAFGEFTKAHDRVQAADVASLAARNEALRADAWEQCGHPFRAEATVWSKNTWLARCAGALAMTEAADLFTNGHEHAKALDLILMRDVPGMDIANPALAAVTSAALNP